MMKYAQRILSVLLAVSMLLSFCGCLRIHRRPDLSDYSSSTTTTQTTTWVTTTTTTTTSATIPTSAILRGTYRASEMLLVPDLSGTDVESAKAILVNCGLVPVVSEEFSNYVTQGLVTRSEPAAFTEVERGSRVTIYVSRGLSQVKASNFRYNWLNKVDNYAPATVKVEQIFVEEDMLYLDFSFQMEYYTSKYHTPFDYDQWYLFFDSFTVNIEGNTIAATASGDAAVGYVEHSNENVTYRMRLQIPLSSYMPHRPSSVEVFCKIHTKQVALNGIGRSSEGSYAYDYRFSAYNITW